MLPWIKERSSSSWPIFVGALVLVSLPIVFPAPYLLHVLTLALLFAVLASSWNLINGFAGLFTFGHQAFFGIGAYASALFAMKVGISPWISIWLAGALAAVCSVFIGLPVLRLRAAPYVAIATLAFAEVMRITAHNLTDLTRGASGLWGIPPFPSIEIPLIGTVTIDAGTKVPYYYLALFLLVANVFLIDWLMRSPTGLALKAIRDSQDAAESLGVPLTRYKLLVFMLSSFLAGVIGGFYAHFVLILTPDSVMSITIMLLIVAITLLGGIGTIYGPVFGALLLIVGLEYLRNFGNYRFMIYGLLMIAIIMFLPQGLARLGLPSLLRWRERRETPSKPSSRPNH